MGMVNGRNPFKDQPAPPKSAGAQLGEMLVKSTQYTVEKIRSVYEERDGKIVEKLIDQNKQQAHTLLEGFREIGSKIELEANKRHDHHHHHEIKVDNPAPTVNNEVRVDASPIAEVIESIDQRAELASITRTLLKAQENAANRHVEIVKLRQADLDMREREIAQARETAQANLAVAAAIQLAAETLAQAMARPRKISIDRDSSGQIVGGESRQRG